MSLLPLPFKHIPNDNKWYLLTIANKKLANFGSKEPSGVDFGTVVGSQKGCSTIDKVVYLGKPWNLFKSVSAQLCPLLISISAPFESFSKKVIKNLGLKAIVEYLQGETIPTHHSKRLSSADSKGDSDSDADADATDRDAEEDEDEDANEDEDEDAGEDEEGEDGDSDSEGSASLCPPKKRRHGETAYLTWSLGY